MLSFLGFFLLLERDFLFVLGGGENKGHFRFLPLFLLGHFPDMFEWKLLKRFSLTPSGSQLRIPFGQAAYLLLFSQI